MPAYSAAQVISPAIQRTKWYLFQPFRLGRFLKLALVATLTEGGFSSCNFSTGIPSSHSGSGSHLPFHWPIWHLPAMPILIGLIAAVSVIVIAVWILISYLLIRLRFSYFDCVLRGQDRIGPAWRLYHRQAMAVPFAALLEPGALAGGLRRGAGLRRKDYFSFTFLARILNQIGVPSKPKAARIWFSRKRWKAKCSFTSRSTKSTKVGGATAAWVM